MGWKYISTANNAWSYISTATNAWKYISAEVVLDYSAEYLAVYEAMTTPPQPSTADAQNIMVESLVSNGIWSQLDVFQLYAQEFNTDGEADINWIDPGTYNASPQDSPVWTLLEGYDGDGSVDYVNTNYNPTIGANYLQDDACFGVYNRVSDPAAALCGVEGTNVWSQIFGVNTLINSGAEVVTALPRDDGLIVQDRSASNVASLYRNGVYVQGSVKVSNKVPNDNFAVLARNDNGVIKSFHGGQASCFFAGGSMTESQHLNVFAAIETYLASL